MMYYLSFTQVDSLYAGAVNDGDSISVSFTMGANRAPKCLADWVGSVGSWTPGYGGPDKAVTILEGEHPANVRVVSTDGGGLDLTIGGALEAVQIDSRVNFLSAHNRYTPLSFRVTRHGESPFKS